MTDKDSMRAAFPTLKGYIALTEDNCAYFISHEGDDLSLFAELTGNLIDKELVVPNLPAGVYLCSDFKATNITYDEGIPDGWDVECEWQPVFQAYQAAQPDNFDFHRVREWALSSPRKPASTSFTASTNRDVAYLIEELLLSQPAQEGLLDPDMPAQELLLLGGEMTESEMRTARAFIRLANSRRQPVQEEIKDAEIEQYLEGSCRYTKEGVDKPYVVDLIERDYQAYKIIKHLSSRKQPVQVSEEVVNLLNSANTKAIGIAAKLVTCNYLPSAYQEDYKSRMPKEVLQRISKTHDYSKSMGNELKTECIDLIHQVLKAINKEKRG